MTAGPSGQAEDRNAKGLLYYQIAAGLLTVLVLVQAVLAGRGWFKFDLDLIDIHGMIGNLTFLVAVAMVAIARFAMTESNERKTLVIMSGILVLLVVAQIGLGYSATSSDNPSAEAASLHIPNGVLIFGLAGAIDARVFGRRG
jgi:heme A synthase